MQFQREQFSQFIDEALPLFRKNYFEIGNYFDDDHPKFNPRLDVYIQLDEDGQLRVYTVRKDGELIGYYVCHVYKHLHFGESLQSVQDALYIDEKHRGFGKDFIKWVDEQLSSEGVDAVYQFVPEKKDWSKILKPLGYDKIESVYLRRL